MGLRPRDGDRARLASDGDGFPVLAEDRAEYAAHLTESHIGVGAIDQRRYQVGLAGSGADSEVALPGERCGDALGVAFAAGPGEARQVVVLGLLADLEQRDGQDLVGILVDV